MQTTTVLLLLSLCACAFAMRKQKYSIEGTLRCGDQPAEGVRVRLMEKDSGFDPDDELDEGRTNGRGRISLSGDTREFSRIDPYVQILHDCNDVEQKTGIPKPCQRKWTITLPESYINGETFDLGLINLEMKLKDEDRDCIN